MTETPSTGIIFPFRQRGNSENLETSRILSFPENYWRRKHSEDLNGGSLVQNQSLVASSHGLFAIVETIHLESPDAEQIFRKILFEEAATELATTALGYPPASSVPQKDLELWRKRHATEVEYLQDLFITRAKIPGKKSEIDLFNALDKLRMPLQYAATLNKKDCEAYLRMAAQDRALENLGLRGKKIGGDTQLIVDEWIQKELSYLRDGVRTFKSSSGDKQIGFVG